MKLNNLIDILVALRDSGALTQDATVYVQGCGVTGVFELEEVKVTLFNKWEGTLFNNWEGEEPMETRIVLVLNDGTNE